MSVELFPSPRDISLKFIEVAGSHENSCSMGMSLSKCFGHPFAASRVTPRSTDIVGEEIEGLLKKKRFVLFSLHDCDNKAKESSHHCQMCD